MKRKTAGRDKTLGTAWIFLAVIVLGLVIAIRIRLLGIISIQRGTRPQDIFILTRSGTEKLRATLFLVALSINLGMWLERFVIVITSLHREDARRDDPSDQLRAAEVSDLHRCAFVVAAAANIGRPDLCLGRRLLRKILRCRWPCKHSVSRSHRLLFRPTAGTHAAAWQLHFHLPAQIVADSGP